MGKCPRLWSQAARCPRLWALLECTLKSCPRLLLMCWDSQHKLVGKVPGPRPLLGKVQQLPRLWHSHHNAHVLRKAQLLRLMLGKAQLLLYARLEQFPGVRAGICPTAGKEQFPGVLGRGSGGVGKVQLQRSWDSHHQLHVLCGVSCIICCPHVTQVA